MYERSVVGTAPFDTDSDTPNTEANEGDDGTIDGEEDFDDDRVVTFVEYRAGTDPFDLSTLVGDRGADGIRQRRQQGAGQHLRCKRR